MTPKMVVPAHQVPEETIVAFVHPVDRVKKEVEEMKADLVWHRYN
jgi:hypothetical protein